MANTFKNFLSGSVGASAATVYTVPSGTTTVTVGMNVANRTASQIEIDAYVTSAEDGSAADVYIVKSAPIPSGGALAVLDGKIVLQTTDIVKVVSNTASSADVILSIMEIT